MQVSTLDRMIVIIIEQRERFYVLITKPELISFF